MIGGKNNERIFQKAASHEPLPEPAESRIDIGHFAIVAAVRVRLMHVVQMNEGEPWMAGLRLNPLGSGLEHGFRGPLDFRRLLTRMRAQMKRAVVDIESLIEAEA